MNDRDPSLLDRLRENGAEGRLPFHMPGYKRNTARFPHLTDLSAAEDITEIDGFDNLHGAEEILADAMARAAIALVCAESPWYREMLLLNSDELEILRFCEGLDPTGRRLIAEEIEGIELRFSTDEDTGAQVYRDGIEIGGWEIGYEARSTGGVYSTTDHSAVILPEGEDGVFEMEFNVRRK